MLARVTARYAEVGKACKSQTEKKQLSLITGSMSEIQFRDDRKKDGRSDAKPFFFFTIYLKINVNNGRALNKKFKV
ncbi:hypothetical protein MTR_8g098810 [Medicago truncatula]|uniref:Uncharacterized protein n=1 Tax=Medicago truncatula TaxID=3880 RepID=A0A072TW49_MEDTR|nr:hypothetical protein MTR_8g098810 [Medicago truncatula]